MYAFNFLNLLCTFKKFPKILAALVNIGHFKKYSCTQTHADCYYGVQGSIGSTGSFGRECSPILLYTSVSINRCEWIEYVSTHDCGCADFSSLLHQCFLLVIQGFVI